MVDELAIVAIGEAQRRGADATRGRRDIGVEEAAGAFVDDAVAVVWRPDWGKGFIILAGAGDVALQRVPVLRAAGTGTISVGEPAPEQQRMKTRFQISM